MSISRGFIFFRAPKYRENLSVNIKQGYYSNKLSNLPQNPNFHHQYKKKFIQEISLKTFSSVLKQNMGLRILSKFSHITKCKIEPPSKTLQKESNTLMMKVLRTVFKILKRLKCLTIHLPNKVQVRVQAFKSLFLLKNLESLTLPNFSYSEWDKNMKFFLETIKLTSKRRSWPYLKSLNIQLQFQYANAPSDDYDSLFTKSLKQLLEFLKALKKHRKIYKCSSFELKLAPFAKMNLEQADLLEKIAKTAWLITEIRECEMKHFQRLPKMIQDAKGLKAFGLVLESLPQPDIDLRIFQKLPNFEELTLKDIYLKKQLLKQIKCLENLTVLSLSFREMPDLQNSQALDLAGMVSNLANLKTIELEFKNTRTFTYFPTKIRLANWSWLRDVFQAIGGREKLKKLSLTFLTFDFEDAESLFQNLCLSLERLKNPSALKLNIRNAESLKDEEVLKLYQSLSRLTSLQNLNLQLLKSAYFAVETMILLVDCVVNLPALSRLSLAIHKVKILIESYQFLSRRINRMNCLIDFLEF